MEGLEITSVCSDCGHIIHSYEAEDECDLCSSTNMEHVLAGE